jgi:hypothetical protein
MLFSHIHETFGLVGYHSKHRGTYDSENGTGSSKDEDWQPKNKYGDSL